MTVKQSLWLVELNHEQDGFSWDECLIVRAESEDAAVEVARFDVVAGYLSGYRVREFKPELGMRGRKQWGWRTPDADIYTEYLDGERDLKGSPLEWLGTP